MYAFVVAAALLSTASITYCQNENTSWYATLTVGTVTSHSEQHAFNMGTIYTQQFINKIPPGTIGLKISYSSAANSWPSIALASDWKSFTITRHVNAALGTGYIEFYKDF